MYNFINFLTQTEVNLLKIILQQYNYTEEIAIVKNVSWKLLNLINLRDKKAKKILQELPVKI